MTIYMLDKRIWFPNPELSEDPHGIIAVGGDLRVKRLVFAYRSGIFPWYNEGEPIIWWSPDPRFVLYPERLKIRRGLRKTLRKKIYEIRYDQAFAKVIDHCATAKRPGQAGTWITRAMRRAYIRLHQAGYAHSVEAYREDRLVGGLYGVALGAFFFGESMFYLEPDASKVALAALAARYREARFIDCQVPNPFFESMGAETIPRDRFLQELRAHVDAENLWEATRPKAGPSAERI